MANTSAVYARIDTKLKKNAESILAQLGITPSSAIQMLYRQIILSRGFPLNLRLPQEEPTCIGGMTKEQIDVEIAKGIEDIEKGRVYSEKEVYDELHKLYGI